MQKRFFAKWAFIPLRKVPLVGKLFADFQQEKRRMSQHRSLRGSGKITSKRNVLKRFERVNLLQKRGEWKEGSRGLGLKKTKPEA